MLRQISAASSIVVTQVASPDHSLCSKLPTNIAASALRFHISTIANAASCSATDEAARTASSEVSYGDVESLEVSPTSVAVAGVLYGLRSLVAEIHAVRDELNANKAAAHLLLYAAALSNFDRARLADRLEEAHAAKVQALETQLVHVDGVLKAVQDVVNDAMDRVADPDNDLIRIWSTTCAPKLEHELAHPTHATSQCCAISCHKWQCCRYGHRVR